MTDELTAPVLADRFHGFGEAVVEHVQWYDHGTSLAISLRGWRDESTGAVSFDFVKPPAVVWASEVRTAEFANDLRPELWAARQEWTWSMDEVEEAVLRTHDDAVELEIRFTLGREWRVRCSRVTILLPE